jgi:ribosomal protein S18 acetylase RimI-like enzyme
MPIRKLDEHDAAAFWNLRLRGLQEHPEAFGETYENFLATPLAEIEQRLRHNPKNPDNFILGAFEETLLGVVAFSRYSAEKARHKGYIWGMYVAPEGRCKGVGKALMRDLVTRLEEMLGITQVTLSVTVGNETAAGLYRALGFDRYGLEQRALKIGDEYYALEHMIKLFDKQP